MVHRDPVQPRGETDLRLVTVNRAVSLHKNILNRILRIVMIAKQSAAIAKDLLLEMIHDQRKPFPVPLLNTDNLRFNVIGISFLFPFRYEHLHVLTTLYNKSVSIKVPQGHKQFFNIQPVIGRHTTDGK